jgi:dihydrofolate reductase
MRPLRYSINVTLDGCCDHRVIVPDEDLHRHAVENLDQADALLFGRVTYEMMEAAFRPPARTGARPDWMEPFARTIGAAKKYVVSSTLDRADWNAELVRGDLGKAVQELKRETGKGLLVGGVKLPLALAELGLIDEYEFVVHPRIAGHGPTLFAGLSKHVDLRLVGRLEFGSGAVAMQYEPRKYPLGLLARVGRIMEQLGQIQWKYSDSTRRFRSNVVSATCHWKMASAPPRANHGLRIRITSGRVAY